MTLTTDANAASRRITVQLLDLLTVVYATPMENPLTANNSSQYYVTPQAANVNVADAKAHQFQWPNDMRFPKVPILRTSTTNIQAGDQFSDITILLDGRAHPVT